MAKYSICITNYNSKDTIRNSLESLLNQLDSNFEVVVCDNYSTDGSREILQEYAKKGKLKLIVEKSSRGKGRQIAFENSSGDYIISGIDMDDILKPTLKEVMKMYHDQHEGYELLLGTIHIIPRKIVEEVGGWKDLQWGEDVDFCKRVESISKLHYIANPWLLILKRGRVRRGPFYKFKERYRFYQVRYQIGVTIFGEVMMNPWYDRPILFFIALAALTMSKLRGVKKFNYK